MLGLELNLDGRRINLGLRVFIVVICRQNHKDLNLAEEDGEEGVGCIARNRFMNMMLLLLDMQ